jgi:Cytochrome b5-like Heme/Steroid binding domain
MLRSPKHIQNAISRVRLACLFFLLVGNKAEPEKVRIVTKEELARHDGNQTEGVLWLSIMSKVYDVSKGAEYYAAGAPYHVFVGRDGNVPFLTGVFNEDEATKPLTELTPHQLYNLQEWAGFYEKEEKYPFIGLLEGDLYDKDGNPTPMMDEVQEMIAEGRSAVAEQKKKTDEIIARRKREAAEKKKKEQMENEEQTQKPKPTKPRGGREALVIEPLHKEDPQAAEL